MIKYYRKLKNKKPETAGSCTACSEFYIVAQLKHVKKNCLIDLLNSVETKYAVNDNCIPFTGHITNGFVPKNLQEFKTLLI